MPTGDIQFLTPFATRRRPRVSERGRVEHGRSGHANGDRPFSTICPAADVSAALRDSDGRDRARHHVSDLLPRVASRLQGSWRGGRGNGTAPCAVRPRRGDGAGTPEPAAGLCVMRIPSTTKRSTNTHRRVPKRGDESSLPRSTFPARYCGCLGTWLVPHLHAKRPDQAETPGLVWTLFANGRPLPPFSGWARP